MIGVINGISLYKEGHEFITPLSVKKYLTIGLLFPLLLTSCSGDWDNRKQKEISSYSWVLQGMIPWTKESSSGSNKTPDIPRILTGSEFTSTDANEQIRKALESAPVSDVAWKTISLSGISAQYRQNLTDFTDTLTLMIKGNKKTIPGPWSSLSPEKRNEAIRCFKENKQKEFLSCGLYDYSILHFSPSGNYVELTGVGWESTIWKMLDTRNGQVVLSNDNGVTKSLWSKDKKRFAFETDSCDIGGCSDDAGIFVTKADLFPQYEKIGELDR